MLTINGLSFERRVVSSVKRGPPNQNTEGPRRSDSPGSGSMLLAETDRGDNEP